MASDDDYSASSGGSGDLSTETEYSESEDEDDVVEEVRFLRSTPTNRRQRVSLPTKKNDNRKERVSLPTNIETLDQHIKNLSIRSMGDSITPSLSMRV